MLKTKVTVSIMSKVQSAYMESRCIRHSISTRAKELDWLTHIFFL